MFENIFHKKIFNIHSSWPSFLLNINGYSQNSFSHQLRMHLTEKFQRMRTPVTSSHPGSWRTGFSFALLEKLHYYQRKRTKNSYILFSVLHSILDSRHSSHLNNQKGQLTCHYFFELFLMLPPDVHTNVHNTKSCTCAHKLYQFENLWTSESDVGLNPSFTLAVWP